MNNLLKAVQKTITERGLLRKGERVLVALSGGADSVCLLSVLRALSRQYDLTLYAAHLHHGLRGEEADADAGFVQSLCEEWCIPLFIRRVAVRTVAEQNKIGLEEAGRQVRYAFFNELRMAEKIDKIATAHHADDNIETVLMRLLRGTGPNGLGGIPYQNGAVVRPLLDVNRCDIEAYLQAQGLSFRIDSTNSETDFTRNRLRHCLIPLLERDYNPGFKQTFQAEIRLYESCASFLEGEVERRIQDLTEPTDRGYKMDIGQLSEQPPYIMTSVLHTLLTRLSDERECGIAAVETAQRVLEKGQGQAVINGHLMAVACYGSFYLRPIEKSVMFNHSVEPEGRFTIPETGQQLIFQPVTAVPQSIGADCAYIKTDMLINQAVTVRSRLEGDSFYPLGMEGKKTIKKFFIDSKIPSFQRDRVPLLVINGEIAWVAGQRVDRRFAAQKGAAALCVTFYEGAQYV